MGLLNSLFGGGTKLELKLDAPQIPEGGMLSGTLLLHGGKKPLTLTTLRVKLVFVHVKTVPGQSLPQIEYVTLLDQVVASNAALAPGALSRHTFTFNVPKGTDPKGTYKVLAHADIPGVADPTADADLKVLPAVERNFLGFAKGSEAMTADVLLQRFPGLRSSDQYEIANALFDVQMAAYDPEENLIVAEPLLARFLREGTAHVKSAALRTWGTILNNRARPEHITTLEQIMRSPDTSRELMKDVVEVAAKFAEEGAMPLVRALAQHPDAGIRSEVAYHLWTNADRKLAERKTLILQLAQDQAPDVRTRAFDALGDFIEDQQVVGLAHRAAYHDPSPDVQAAAIRVLSSAHYHGHRDLVFDTYVAHLQNSNANVRGEIADRASWLPRDARLETIVTTLLRDKDTEVRRKMAWQAINMSEHPELAGVFAKCACEDPEVTVRAAALEGFTSVAPLGDAIAFYRQRLNVDFTEQTAIAVADALRRHAKEPVAQALLADLSNVQYARVAERAREILANP